MMRRLAGLKALAPFRRFRQREDGAVLVEGLLLLPLLLWAAFGLYVYWDAYRTINTVQKASNTVAEAFSRQESSVNAAFARGITNTMGLLMKQQKIPRVRYSSVEYVASKKRFELNWSCSLNPSAMPPWTTTTLQTVANRLPTTADGFTLLLIETEVPYEPPLNIGLNAMNIRQFIFIKPRFVSKVGFADIANCK